MRQQWRYLICDLLSMSPTLSGMDSSHPPWHVSDGIMLCMSI